MKKSTLSILLLFLMILSITAVSAADNVTSDADDSLISDDVAHDGGALKSPDTEVLTAPEDKNFTQLKDDLDLAVDDTVYLDSNYTMQAGEERITINKNLVIYGQNHKIDANGLDGIFNISKGCSVVLTDVILVNGNGTDGGAIYNEGTLMLTNTNISNCEATCGGAVYNSGVLTMGSGSTLSGNTAIAGGALYSLGTAVVDGAYLNDNEILTTYGGAIYNEGNLTVKNSIFDNAQITNAIVNYNNLSLSNNGLNGAVIYNDGGIITSRVTVNLTQDEYSTYDGLVLVMARIKDDSGNVVVDESFKFDVDGTQYDAKYDSYDGKYYKLIELFGPGVFEFILTSPLYTDLDTNASTIRNYMGTFTDLKVLIDEAFVNNDGVLDLPYNFTYTGEIDGLNFLEGILIENPLIINGNGYTISGIDSARIFNISAATTLKNVTLTNASVKEKGAAVYTTADLTVEDAVFENNKVTEGVLWTPGFIANGGAAIYATNDAVLVVKNSNFTNNVAEKETRNHFTAAAVFAVAAKSVEIDGCTFTGNEGVLGGAVEVESLTADADQLVVKNSVFENNKAWQGGAINVNDEIDSFTIENTNFTKNAAVAPEIIPGNNPLGGAIYGYASHSNITGCTFTENTADAQGGAIFADGDTFTISNSKFIGNEARSGAAIFSKTGVELELCQNIINKTDAQIYNYGKIISPTNVTVLGNNTVKAHYGENITLNATYADDNGNLIYVPVVDFQIEGVDIVIPAAFENGMYVASYKADIMGEWRVYTNLFDATQHTGLLDIGLIPTFLAAEVLEKYQGDDDRFAVVLTDADGNPVAGMPVRMRIVGKVYNCTTNESGVATLPINLKIGSYPVTVEFAGKDNYSNATPVSSEVHVLTKIRIDKNKDLVKDYGDADKFTVRLLDGYGKPVAGEVVNMTVAGKTYHCKSNADGYASLAINLKPGTYDIVCEYAGYKTTNKITVKQVLSAYNRQYKKASSYQFTATLKHTNGNPISGKTVTFSFKGKTYTATSNSKGEATITIKEALNIAKYNIYIRYLDSTITRTITIK